MSRLGQSEEIATVYSILDKAKFVTGQMLYVNLKEIAHLYIETINTNKNRHNLILS